jgi:hypothetical protein
VENLKALLEVEVSLGCPATEILIELPVGAASSLVSSHIVWSWSCVYVGRLMCHYSVCTSTSMARKFKMRRTIVHGSTKADGEGQWPHSHQITRLMGLCGHGFGDKRFGQQVFRDLKGGENGMKDAISAVRGSQQVTY